MPAPYPITRCSSADCPERTTCARALTAALDLVLLDAWMGIVDLYRDVPIGIHCPLRIPLALDPAP
jgi:hypothetical protein